MTEVQLKEYLEALINEADKRYEQRFVAQEKATAAALAAADKANALSEANAEKWRTNANEWRQAMNDRERNFLSRGMGYIVGSLSIIALVITIAQRFH